MYTRKLKSVSPLIMCALLLITSLGCIGSIYHKLFLVRGTAFYPNNGIEYEFFSIDIWVTAGSSRKPILDSTYHVYIYTVPKLYYDSLNIDFLKNFELDRLLFERVGHDVRWVDFLSHWDTITTYVSRESRFCRKIDFGHIMIPSHVDTVKAYISFNYLHNDSRISADTSVSLFRADAKHTGPIAH
jgi:hypothetical protein